MQPGPSVRWGVVKKARKSYVSSQTKSQVDDNVAFGKVITDVDTQGNHALKYALETTNGR
jgi:hypothetical protein